MTVLDPPHLMHMVKSGWIRHGLVSREQLKTLDELFTPERYTLFFAPILHDGIEVWFRPVD